MVQMKRHTSSSTRSRRSHHALKAKTLNVCPQCGKAVEPHKACLFCGNYKGVEVVVVKKPSVKTAK